MFKRVSFLTTLTLAAVMLFQGCRTTDDRLNDSNLYLTRAHVETSPTTPSEWSMQVTMPLSEAKLHVLREWLFTERNILNVELVRVEGGLAVLFQLDQEGSRNLYMATVQNMGRRILVTINGQPVGLRVISAPANDGNWMTFLEMEDEALEELVINLKESTTRVQEIIAKEKRR